MSALVLLLSTFVGFFMFFVYSDVKQLNIIVIAITCHYYYYHLFALLMASTSTHF